MGLVWPNKLINDGPSRQILVFMTQKKKKKKTEQEQENLFGAVIIFLARCVVCCRKFPVTLQLLVFVIINLICLLSH